MTTRYGRTLHRFIPTRFALRMLCPGIYTYAKNTGWPSSYAQLLRDRRLVNASLNFLYASLRFSRLRRQAAVQVKTATFEATVYYTAKSAAPLTSWPSVWRKTATHSTTQACDRTSASANSGPLHASVSNAIVREAAEGTLPECPPPVPEAAHVRQTTASPAGQCTARSGRTPTMVEALPHVKKEATSKESFQKRAHYLKGWTESAIRFAPVLHEFSRGAPAHLGVTTTDASVCAGDTACPKGYKPYERAVTGQPVTRWEISDSGTQWLFFIHGGAFVLGSPAWYRLVINDLSVLTGAKVFCPNYRLAPENPWPAQLIDCRAAYEHLCLVEGVKGEDIIVVGDSAGGNLAAALVMSIVKRPFADVGKAATSRAEQAKRLHPFPSVPAGLLLMSPWLDLSMKGPSYALNRLREPVLPLRSIRRAGSLYLHGQFEEGGPLPVTASSSFDSDARISYGSRNATNPWVSPVYAHDSVLLARMPPALVHVGSLEVLLSDSLIFARRVNEAVGGARIPCQPWIATELQTYQDAVQPPAAVEPATSLALSVSENRLCNPASEKTRDRYAKQRMARAFDRRDSRHNAESSVPSSDVMVGACAAGLTPEKRAWGGSFYYGGSRGVPSYFQHYGWLGEADIRTMDRAGVVCACGCGEDDRVQVKVWKDEFHGFTCCSFLEAPNGERSLLEMASWAKKRLAEARECGRRRERVVEGGK